MTFSDDTKPPASAPDVKQEASDENANQKLDGVVGQLEVYASGAVKMRLANGIVMDVSYRHPLASSRTQILHR